MFEDEDVDLGEFYYDAHDIAQEPADHHQQANRPQTPGAEREITQLAQFSNIFPEENVEVLRKILQDSDYNLENAIVRLTEIRTGDQEKGSKSNSTEQKQVKNLAESGVVPKRHTPEAIEAKLVMIHAINPNVNDTGIRHRLEDSMDLNLETQEIINELQTQENKVSEPNFKQIHIDTNMEEYLSEQDKTNLLHITQIFPDVDPHYLFDQIAVQLKSLENIVDNMTHDSSYPKLKQRLEKEGQERRRQEFLNSGQFNIESYLLIFEEPESYFNDQTRNVTQIYTQHAVVHLMNLFRNMREDFLRRQLQIHNNHFLPTFRTISNRSSDRDSDGQRRKPINFGMPQYNGELRPVVPWPDEIDEMFFRELQYLQHQDQIREFVAERNRQREQREHEARAKGQLIECECCFIDNKLPEDMIACQENDKHIFCRDCVQSHAEMQVTNESNGVHEKTTPATPTGWKHTIISKVIFNLMTGTCIPSNKVVLLQKNSFRQITDTMMIAGMTCYCSSEYNVGILQKLVRSASMNILLRRRQQDELRNAQLSNTESCPFCDFAMVIENNDEKVFKCHNPNCLRESCRQCKEPNHIPLRCNEVEKDADTRMRTYVENKMAEAWIRICPKCNKRLIKTDGCNALHCLCGAGICYVCNELLPAEGHGYGHFFGPGQNFGFRGHFTEQNVASKASRCPLHTGMNEVNADIAERAGKEARALYLKENPNVMEEKQKMDDQRVEQLVDRQASDERERYFRMGGFRMAQFGDMGMLRQGPQHHYAPGVDFGAMNQYQREMDRDPFRERYHARRGFGHNTMDQELAVQRRVQELNRRRDRLQGNIEQQNKDIEEIEQERTTLSTWDSKNEYLQARINELEKRLEERQRIRRDDVANLELSTRELREANEQIRGFPQQDPQDAVQYNFGDVEVPPGATVHIKSVGGVQHAVAVSDGSKVKEEPSTSQGQKSQTVDQKISYDVRNTGHKSNATAPRSQLSKMFEDRRKALIEEQRMKEERHKVMVKEQMQVEQQMINEHDYLDEESQALDEQINALQRRKREVQDQMVRSEQRLAQARERHAIELDNLNIGRPSGNHLAQRRLPVAAAASIDVGKSQENMKKGTDAQLAQSTVVLIDDDDDDEMDSMENNSKSDGTQEGGDKNSRINTILDLVRQSIPNAERQQVVSALLKQQKLMGGRVANQSLSELVKLIVSELKPVCSVHPIQRKSVAKSIAENVQSAIQLNVSGDHNQDIVTEPTARSDSGDLHAVTGLSNNAMKETSDDSTITMRIGRDSQLNINIQLPQQQVQQVQSQPSGQTSESEQKVSGVNVESKSVEAAEC